MDIITEGNYSVSANTDSLFAAFEEIALAFGNDGSDPSRLTVDLSGAVGMRAWPIAQLAYLSFRVDADDSISNCTTRRTALMSFLEYAYSNQGYGSALFNDNGIAALTPQASDQVLALIQSTMKCNGQLVYTPPPARQLVTVQLDESLLFTFQIMGDAFAALQPVQMDFQPLESHSQIHTKFACLTNASCQGVTGGLQILADENLSSFITNDDEEDDNYELITMPYCAMAVGIIYNFCAIGDDTCSYLYQTAFVLDIPTAAAILDRKILYWNDSAIQALNPEKTLPSEPIEVLAGPKTSTFHYDFIELVREEYDPSFSYSGGGLGAPTYYDAWIDVSLNPYSVSFVPFNGTVVQGVEQASLVSRLGEVVAPGPTSIEACARDSYDPTTGLFSLSTSK